jgi:hypothetical protein
METSKIFLLGSACLGLSVFSKHHMEEEVSMMIVMFLCAMVSYGVVFCRVVGQMDLCNPKNKKIRN